LVKLWVRHDISDIIHVRYGFHLLPLSTRLPMPNFRG
jgi:hypothetical protein